MEIMLDISKIVNDFYETEQLKSIHIDEVISTDLLLTKKDIFFKSTEVYKNIISDFSKNKPISVQIDLQIELVGEDTSVKGVPKNLDELIDSIDDFAMPEISISIPKKIIWPPKLEMYICTIPFKMLELPSDISILYEEYRTIDELLANDPFYRWLTCSYIVGLDK